MKNEKHRLLVIDIGVPILIFCIILFISTPPKAFFISCLTAMSIIIVQENKLNLSNKKEICFVVAVFILNLAVILNFVVGDDLNLNLLYAQIYVLQGMIMHYIISKMLLATK